MSQATDNPTNVTELRPQAERQKAERVDPTAAERQKRFRKRKQATKRPVTLRPAEVPVVAPLPTVAEPSVTLVPSAPVTVPAVQGPRNGVTVATLMAALALAAVSAGFSITGMTSIFVGSFWPVIGMGVALELGKLSAVAWLGRYHGSIALRAALIVLVAVLMALNAVGAYGFLAKAHIGHAVAGDIVVSSRAADVDARIQVQAGIVADIDRRIAQIDTAVDQATARGRTNSAMALAEQQRKARADLVAQRTNEAKALAVLKVEKATADRERAKVDADLGPVRYLASLLGANDQDVLRWFILVIALLLDPAAVLLLLAAASR